MRSKRNSAKKLKRKIVEWLLAAILLACAPPVWAAVTTAVSNVPVGWSHNKQRNVFYNGSNFFLLYTTGNGNIYYKASADNVTWSGQNSLVANQNLTRLDFDLYLVNDNKLDLIYIDNSGNAKVTTVSISGQTLTPDAGSIVSSGDSCDISAPDYVSVGRTPSANRIHVTCRPSSGTNIYGVSANQTGDAAGVTTWNRDSSGSGVGFHSIIPFGASDQSLLVLQQDNGGTANDGIYSRRFGPGVGTGSTQIGDLNDPGILGNTARISDTDFRYPLTKSGASIEEYSYDGSTAWNLLGTIDAETDQIDPSFFYDRTSGDLYMLSIDSGSGSVERHRKPNGGAWEVEVVADGGEATARSLPVTQMNEPPTGSSRTTPRMLVWAYRVANGANYDLVVGNLCLAGCGSTISGRVFEDANFAGTASDWDGGTNDQALVNVDVELYNNSDVYQTSTTTDASGNFSFTGLANGTYKVRVRSATIGDADTTPKGTFNACVPATCAYPLPEMAWGNGAALYGGQSATVDDTATGDNAGPGDTYLSVTISGASVSNVNFGFAYNLIVNKDDDSNAVTVRSKQGSLRQFIKNANAIGTAGSTTANSSQFRIPAGQLVSGVATLQPSIALPTLTDNGTTLDASTQTTNIGDTNANGPEIEIDGTSVAVDNAGVKITSANNTVRGLVINRFAGGNGNGIYITGAGATGNTIVGNYLGTDPTGTMARPNGDEGIYVETQANGNTIGGTNLADRNLISGNTGEGILIKFNSDNNTILGNYIGTDRTGTVALPNGTQGVRVDDGCDNTTIGGAAANAGNLISGNTGAGITIMGLTVSTGTLVRGNRIGTQLDGVSPLGNGSHGIEIAATGSNVTLGGTAAGQANVIAYNGGDGVYVSGASSDLVTLSANSIHSNTGLGIDLDPDGVGTGGGANNNKARPTITSITPSGANFTISATVTSGDTIEFFRVNNSASPTVTADPSGSGEGYLYLGKCVDNGACSGPYMSSASDGNAAGGTVQATLLGTILSQGDLVTATATDGTNGTSEFAVNGTVPAPACNVVETPVYKSCVAKGEIYQLLVKQSASPTTNLLIGAQFGQGYGDTAGVLSIANDAGTTETVQVNNSAVFRVQYSGALKNGGGTSYGTSTATLTFYRDRFIVDTTSTMSSNPGTGSKLHFLSPDWQDSTADETYQYCTGACGSFNSRNPTGAFTTFLNDTATPITVQTLHELGATDGLVSMTVRDLYGGLTAADLEDYDPDTTQMNTEVTKAPPTLSTTYRGAALYSIATTGSGFNTTLAKQYHDDYMTPATLDFTGGDGVLTGDGFAEERGAYTLDDNDADDHVLFTFNVGAITPRIKPVFEISNWNSAAPSTLLVAGVTKNINTDYTAAVSGTTLYLQYLSDLSANTLFEIPPFCPGGVVTTTADSGAGSLRECINYANANPGTTLSFNIPGPGNQSSGADSWWRITLSGSLPPITGAGTIIDGTTQTTNQGNTNSLGPEVELYGNGLSNGFDISGAANVRIQGLVINGFSGAGGFGVRLTGAGTTGAKLYGNYIGTNATGTAAVANVTGVSISGSASGNDVGGSGAGQRNIISGNSSAGVTIASADNNTVRGNYLGTDAAGTAAVANTFYGLSVSASSGTLLGGVNAGEGNVISGNGDKGMQLTGASSMTIQGNTIGLNAARTAKVANGNRGIGIDGANPNNITIGGAAAGAANIISGNTNGAINISSNANNIFIYGNKIGTGPLGTEGGLGNTGFTIDIGSNHATPNIKVGGLASGQGNIIAESTSVGVSISTNGGGIEISGNTIRNNGVRGIAISADGVTVTKNLVRNNGFDGILLWAGGTNAKIYQNTIHSNSGDGIEVQGTGAVIKNNIITGHSAWGINVNGGSMTEAYNLVTNASTTPANTSGQSNAALSATTLNANPLYTNSGSGDYTLQNGSPAVNRGCNLGAAGDDTACDDAADGAQIDMTAGANPNFYGYAPDMGAFENSAVTNTCPVSTTADGTAPIPWGSLRDCINWANGNAGQDTITFDTGVFAPGTINVTAALPTLTDASGAIIDGGNASNVIIDGSTPASAAGFTLNSNSNQIKNMTIRNFKGAGAGSGAGIYLLTGRANNTLSNNIIQNNQGEGIYLEGTNTQNTISGNTITGNAFAGIHVIATGGTCVTRNSITGNTVSNNGTGATKREGIKIGNSACELIDGNTVNGNGNFGIFLSGSSTTGVIVTNNSLSGNNPTGEPPSGTIGVFTGANANRIAFNTLKDNKAVGILIGDSAPDSQNNIVEGNLILRTLLSNTSSRGHGIMIYSGGNNTKIYQNTVHGNQGHGVTIGGTVTGFVVKNNLFSNNTGAGLNAPASAEIAYNDYYNNTGGSCTGGCANGTGSITTDPQYINPTSPTDDFHITECSSPAINAGVDLAADQPDMNGGGSGNYNGSAPDMGSLESSCGAILSLVKQVWQVGGSAPLALSNGAPTSTTVPSGQTIVFLIYVKNPNTTALADIRFSDLLDVSASGFDYVPGSLVRDDGSLSDAATDLQIFNATAPGTGTALTDAVDGDIASVCDSGAGACPGTTLNRVTVGNTTGLTPAQANGTLLIPANKTFAIRFRAVKK